MYYYSVQVLQYNPHFWLKLSNALWEKPLLEKSPSCLCVASMGKARFSSIICSVLRESFNMRNVLKTLFCNNANILPQKQYFLIPYF